MARTTLDLTKEERQAYRPVDRLPEGQVAERWERAYKIARQAAEF